MKICFIAPANNYHTKKWCNWFLNRGHEIHVISFIDEMIPDVFVHYIDAKVQIDGTDFAKVRYLCYAHKIKKFVSEINHDIVHVKTLFSNCVIWDKTIYFIGLGVRYI